MAVGEFRVGDESKIISDNASVARKKNWRNWLIVVIEETQFPPSKTGFSHVFRTRRLRIPKDIRGASLFRAVWNVLLSWASEKAVGYSV